MSSWSPVPPFPVPQVIHAPCLELLSCARSSKTVCPEKPATIQACRDLLSREAATAWTRKGVVPSPCDSIQKWCILPPESQRGMKEWLRAVVSMAEAVSEKSTEREGDGARTNRRGSAEVLQRFFISKVAGVQAWFDKKEEGSFALTLVGGVVSS